MQHSIRLSTKFKSSKLSSCNTRTEEAQAG